MLDPKNKNDGGRFEEEVEGLFEGPISDDEDGDEDEEDDVEGEA